MRTRIGVQRIQLAVLAAIAAALAAAPVALSRYTSLQPLTWALTIPNAVMLVGVAYGLVRYRRNKRILTLIPEHDAQVCPRCIVALARSGAQPTCPRCGRSYDTARLASYWERYPTHPWAAADADLGTQSAEQRRHPYRGVALLTSTLWIAAIIVMGVLARLMFAGPWYVHLLDILPLMLAVALFPTGLRLLIQKRRRVGDEPRCARCEYIKAPGNDDPLARCPECGNLWNLSGGTVRGRLPSGRLRRLAGLGLMLVALLVFLGRFVSLPPTWSLMRLAPTTLLIDRAVYGTSPSVGEAWAELNRRSLTPDQRTRLATELLERRADRGVLDAPAASWLWVAIRSGTLPQPIVKRFFRESFEAHLEAPRSVRVGQAFRVRLVTTSRPVSGVPGVFDLVYVGGFRIGADPTPIQRRGDADFAALLDQPEYAVSAKVVPTEAGPLRIRLDLWFVVTPNPASGITWQPDGSPQMPPTVFWREHRTPEVIVTVRPAAP